MKRFAGVSLWLLLYISAVGQSMLGVTLGNYAGINSIQLNPSAILNSKAYLDIQFLGTGFFLDNNALYISKQEFAISRLFTPGYQLPLHKELYGTRDRPFYLYNNTHSKNAFQNLLINGPGAMLIWKHHAFAINTSLRSVVSLIKIPHEIVNFSYLGLNYRPQQNIDYKNNIPFRGAAMVWGEIGLTYAYTFYASGLNKISAGINIKRLFGAGAIYANVNNIDYTVLNDTTMTIRNLDSQMGLALPVDYSTNKLNLSKTIKGTGFGADFGITYTRISPYHQAQYFSTACSQKYENYIYRFGVALIDLGAIRFSSNALNMRIDNRSSFWEHLTNFNYPNFRQFLDTLSTKFYHDTTSIYVGTKFDLWLPAVLSIQFDYHLRKNWYVNTSFLYGLKIGMQSIARPSEISVTPRYESEWFEASLPFSLYDFTWPRVGIAVRVYGFTIGTDNLESFFNLTNFSGLDFYFGIKYFISAGKCRSIELPVNCFPAH
ncbi:MAG: DUF5723 family protein [Bacteroidales bacterium]|jgi:hypothetical protein|nr:DUF5723 family protein [Bacteroidales bacterium]